MQADDEGVINFHFCYPETRLDGEYGIMNRALVIHAGPDDVGTGGTSESASTGSSGARLTCALILPF